MSSFEVSEPSRETMTKVIDTIRFWGRVGLVHRDIKTKFGDISWIAEPYAILGPNTLLVRMGVSYSLIDTIERSAVLHATILVLFNLFLIRYISKFYCRFMYALTFRIAFCRFPEAKYQIWYGCDYEELLFDIDARNCDIMRRESERIIREYGL